MLNGYSLCPLNYLNGWLLVLLWPIWAMVSATDLDLRWQRNLEAHQKRLALKEQAIAYLGGRCQICGYDRCPAAFDFHHPDPRTKDFTVSVKTVWSEALEAELRKCVLLCSNCHREVHAGWHAGLIEDDELERGGSLYEEDSGIFDDLDDSLTFV